MKEITLQPALNADEYLSDDGLICCSLCHTLRQLRITFAGIELTPRILCQCQQEAHDNEQRKRKHQEFLKNVQRMKSAGLQDKALYEYCFANDNGQNPQMKLAHAYVEHWEEMRDTGSGLLLWGGVGTGKSFFAVCIANALLERGIPVLVTNFARILNALTGMYSEDRNEYIESLNRYGLLIIDDLGIERSTEFAMEQIFGVIDSRYRSRKPLIVCTNLPLKQLHEPEDLAHARIYDRILERCVPIRIDGPSLRQVNAKAGLGRARELLISDLQKNDTMPASVPGDSHLNAVSIPTESDTS